MSHPPPEAETDSRLQALSDTDILLNFAAALERLYPNMRAVCAHCWDPYDAVVEPLFYALVFNSFSGKYGIVLPEAACHVYEMHLGSFGGVHHVRVVPGRLPLRAHDAAGREVMLTKANLTGRDLAFINFGDGVHSLTGGEVEGDPYDVSFHLTCFVIIDSDSGVPVPDHPALWVSNHEITYEFVATSTR